MAQQAKNFIVRYIMEVKEEMNKVTWPTPKQVRNNTIIVIAISIGIALFFWALDLFFTYLLNILFAA